MEGAMRINNIGYNHSHDADFFISRPNGSGDWLLLLIKTEALFTFDDKEMLTEPNSFILFREGTPQYYRSSGGVFTNDWFHFSFEDDDFDFIESLDIPTDKVVAIDGIDRLSLLVKNMCYEHYSSNMYRTDSVDLYTKLLFIKLSELVNRKTDSDATSYYDKLSILRTKIYSQPFNDWSVDWLSHELTLSKSYFQHLYKEYFGVSVMSDVINSRVEHGKFLLSSTDISVRQISQMCGYKNDIHFMRQFKSLTGMTPSQYRESVQS